MAPRKVCVVTTGRADYGLLRWLLMEMRETDGLEPQIVVSGSHLMTDHGETWREIEADGCVIDARVDIGPDDDTRRAAARAAAKAVDGMAAAFESLMPDIVVVLGDRYEILATATAALMLDIPVAHLHGGEITEGALDDQARHAVTKLSHLHFAAAEPYARRIRQMGEAADRVFTVGALGLEAIRRTTMLTRAELEDSLGTALGAPLFVVTYHPETLGETPAKTSIDALIGALAKRPDAHIVFTGVNADPGSAVIRDSIVAFARDNAERVHAFESLGSRRYLSLVSLADAAIGNSSSGIIEVPALGVPTVNIGTRQAGRLRAESVIDCGATETDIGQAIAQALDPAFRERARRVAQEYGTANTARIICDTLRAVPLKDLTRKPFVDLAWREAV